MISKSAKLQFLKDFKIPIQVTEEPYFSDLIELYADKFQSKKLFDLFLKSIENAGGEKELYKNNFKIVQKMIEYVQNNEHYKELCTSKLILDNTNFQHKKLNVYSHDNHGKTFISIDLKEANFQSFNSFDPRILNANSYKEFASKFTDSEYFIQSKSFRQNVFGSLNPKQQQKLQRQIMDQLIKEIVALGIDSKYIFIASSDEIIFENKYFNDLNAIKNLNLFKEINFKIEKFRLEHIREDLDIFIKRFSDYEDYEIKKCSSKNMAEVFKYVNNLPLTKNDLVFIDDGRICFYEKPLI